MPRLCVIEGDGIGQEVIPVAVQVLEAVIPDLECVSADAGWECFQQRGVSVPDETLEAIRDCGAGLFGAVSSPLQKVEGYQSAILCMRQRLDLFANIRPVESWPHLSKRQGVELVIVRENTEGLYSRRERCDGETAVAEKVVTKAASRRIGEKAFGLATQLRKKKVTIVHKANVLSLSDGLFRDSVVEVGEERIADGVQVDWDEKLVDIAALQMATEPERFEIVVTTNLYGDILSDVAAMWGGGLGMVPSLNLGEDFAVAEPVHGSAPDIAGQGTANPLAAVLSAEMLVRYVWQLPEEADRIKTAVRSTLNRWGQLDSSRLTQQVGEALLGELCP